MKSRFSRWLTTGLLAVLALPLRAEPMPVEDVAAAARGWLMLHKAAPFVAPLGTTLDFLAPVPDDQGTVLYYVASVEQGGTVVMSPDNAIEPVIAFSEMPVDLLDLDPCNHLRLMLDSDMAARLADVREKAVKDAPAKALKWERLIAASRGVKGGMSGISDVRRAPLTTTRWSQSYVYQGSTKLACYNYVTPPYGAGNAQNYYCGCVATALAQIMRYHRYPRSGVGTALYGIRVNGSSVTRALKGGNGTGGRYDWASMADDPAALAKAGKLTATQRIAIGYLCHDAGVASHMSYYAGGSSASLCWSAGYHPLETVFKYANVESPWVSAGSTFSKKAINQALNPCLDAGLPCALAIRDLLGGGHAVLADGYGYYASTLYHHLNLGWGGSDTAWYNLPVVSTSSRSYTRVDGLVFNIHPAQADFSIISGRVLDAKGNPLNGIKVVCKDAGGTAPDQTAFSNAKGIYYIMVPFGEYSIRAQTLGFSYSPASRDLIVGSRATRNSAQNTFTRVAP